MNDDEREKVLKSVEDSSPLYDVGKNDLVMIYRFFDDTFITMLDNAYDIYIPTSSKRGFNIFDHDDSDSKNVIKYMRDTMAWWHRLDDGPELIAGSPDDCSIYEYVLRNTHYI